MNDKSEFKGDTSVVTFVSAGNSYAILSRFVFAVAPLGNPTLVPNAPRPLIGVTEFRGYLLPVFSIADQPTRSPTESYILVFGREEAEFGIVADELPNVVRADPGLMTEPKQGGLLIARWGKHTLLNGAEFLDDPRFSVA